MGKWNHGGNLLRTAQLVAEMSESRAISNNPERGEESWLVPGGPGEGHGGGLPWEWDLEKLWVGDTGSLFRIGVSELSVSAHTCRLSAWKAEAGGC